MPFAAKVICDSLNPYGVRLTTFQVSWPRIIWSELLTHRMLSRNASSSRAIPAKKLIQQVEEDPFIPIKFFKNQAGMQTDYPLEGQEAEDAKNAWLEARNSAVSHAYSMLGINITKSLINRIIEPWMWAQGVVSGTDWGNFFSLRYHGAAEANFQHMVELMRQAYIASTPRPLKFGEWHLPYILEEERDVWDVGQLVKFSTARCCRVSYLNHDQTNPVAEKDIELHDRLVVQYPVHASPAEHPAQASIGRHGNYNGFKQYRKTIPQENIETFPFEVPKHDWEQLMLRRLTIEGA